MPDEFDVRDDHEEAHEEGGDDEVGLSAIKSGGSDLHSPCSFTQAQNQWLADLAL